MTDERKCPLCDAGLEVIDGWHYVRPAGTLMVFPTNKRCEKLYPPKPKPTHLPVFLLPELQCAACGGALKWQPAKTPGDRPTEKTECWPAYCNGCDVTVSVPLTLRTCEVVSEAP